MARELSPSPKAVEVIGRILLFLCWMAALSCVIELGTPLHLPAHGVGYVFFRSLYYVSLIGFPISVFCLREVMRSRWVGLGVILYVPYYIFELLAFVVVHLNHYLRAH